LKIAQYYRGSELGLGIVGEDKTLSPIRFKGDMNDFILSGGSKITTGESFPLEEVRLASPVTRPSKIIALGLNYSDHIRESKGQVPKAPLIFAKFPSSIIGHRDPIEWNPAVTSKVDFEAELAVVMGKCAQCIPEGEALSAVFGYTCANDVSARDLQFGDGQWTRGKSLDSFCPMGPWLVTKDEVPDPHNLRIRCVVNGKVMQDSSTSEMIFRIPYVISFLSRHFTLYPGDVILTGTPHGVGAFRDPPMYLGNGDEVTVEIEKIGRLLNRCKALDSR
jgi:2-keto-4-pentenoate hydratase/2-oxohepta-3-ene-1,7-dioic acid hydratase in catechol pathway